MSCMKLKDFINFAFLCVLLCTLFGYSYAEIQVSIQEKEWTWNENDINSFQGTIITDHNIPNAVLTLSVKTRLEDSGEILFTSTNGKKLKIRKRGPSTEADLSSGEEFSFEGEWDLPSNTKEGIAWAEITLKIDNSDGQEESVKKIEFGNLDNDQALKGSSLSDKVNHLIIFFLIACICIWLLAIARYLILKKKKKRKG